MGHPVETLVFENGDGQFVSGGTRVLTGGASSPIAMLETTVPPGFPGPKLHRHARMFDIFYVLEGSLLFQIEGEQRRLDRGGFAMVPPGVIHTFSNPGTEPARFINIYQPAGLEEYVIEIAKRMAAGVVPTQDEMAELALNHDFQPVE